MTPVQVGAFISRQASNKSKSNFVYYFKTEIIGVWHVNG